MNRNRLKHLLDTIWSTGDRDVECAVKHICHASAAIIVGNRWSDGLDYKTSGFNSQQWKDIEESEAAAKNGDKLPCGRPNPWQGRDMYKEYSEQNLAKLETQWKPIEDWVNEAGTEAFYDLIMQTEYNGYIDSYIEDNCNDGETCPEWGEIVKKTFQARGRDFAMTTFQKKE